MSPVISYDRRSFKVDGVPFLILSGSVHYIRVHPSRWSALFDTFRAARLNTIETYVFWSEHDRAPDPPDFAGRRDLFGFIAAAGAAGLRVILRLGPYVCAEVSYGGLPARLRDVPGVAFRTFNAPFMREVAGWLRFVARQLHERRLLAPAGGAVMLVQLENEYGMVSDGYAEDGARYLQWVADLQRELGFGVPGIMCYGAADGVVETINAFYGHEHVAEHRGRHGDQPPVWTEAWTGWYDTWGAPHHVRAAEDLAYAVARFFAAGGAGVNYYMWMGGTNYGRSPMYAQVPSYDYDAPVDEFYRARAKARHLGALHAVLLDAFQEPFMRERGDDARARACEGDGGGGVFVWGDVAFVCNDGDEELRGAQLPSGAYAGVVRAKSVHIVDGGGRLLFDTARVRGGHDDAPRRVPVACEHSEWTCARERVPTFDGLAGRGDGDGRVVRAGTVPVEQLELTGDKSDYAFYLTRVRGSGATTLMFEAADVAYVFVDGAAVGRSAEPPWEDRWRNRWNAHAGGERGTAVAVRCEIRGDAELCVMTCSLGLVKGDWQLGAGRGMQHERKGLLSDVRGAGVVRMCEWRCAGGLAGEAAGFPTRGVRGEPGARGSAPGWYECVVRAAAGSDAWVLDLGALGKGAAWVNGQLLARFWDVAGTRPRNGFLDASPVRLERAGQPSQRFYHVPQWMARADARGVALRVVLFVERGPPPAHLPLLRVL